MTNEVKKLLFDILTACDEISTFIAGKTGNDYLSERLLRRAVERDLEIVGEAMSQLREIDPNTTNRIPNAPRIIAMRHRLIHAYGQVNDEIVWDTVENNIPDLRQVVQQLLDE